MTTTASEVVCEALRLVHNMAAADGGAVCAYSTQFTAADSLFRGNTALGSGGALFAWVATATLIDATFIGNAAARGADEYCRSARLIIARTTNLTYNPTESVCSSCAILLTAGPVRTPAYAGGAESNGHSDAPH